jgi:hypothetical protein
VSSQASSAVAASDLLTRTTLLFEGAARAGAPAHIEARPALAAEGSATPRRPPGFVQLGAFALLPLVLFAVGSQLFRGGGLHWPVLICCLVFVLLVSLRRSA